MESVSDNLKRVRQSIHQACDRAGRNPDDVSLVVVTKKQTADAVRQAVSAGAVDLGENYVQEAEGKIGEVGRNGIRWHLIGHLQSNKAKAALQLFDVVQTIDSISLAERLDRVAGELGRTIEVLIEVNVGGELTKSGIPADDILELAEAVDGLKSLQLTGLMSIPPVTDDEIISRKRFQQLKELFDKLPDKNRRVLSMGMSGDFVSAILEGSTMVRVGTAIFGHRV